MSGTAVTLFNNFMEAQGPLYVTSPEDVYNDAQLFKTWSTGALMGGDRGKRRMVTGGSEIRFATFFETGQVTRHVQPGETRTWSQPQKLVHGAAPMRYRESHMAWTRQVIMHNQGLRNGEFDQYVNHKHHLEQVMWTDYWNFDEAHIWSEPNYSEMEVMTGTEGQFYSIPAFINEYTNGLFNNSGTAGTAWTRIHGLDPTSTTRGQNRYVHNTVTYSNAVTSANSVFSNSTILTAFTKAWFAVNWTKPPKNGEYFDDVSINNQTIYCSPEGQLAYEIALRGSQDAFVMSGRQDSAYNGPTYNGIPMRRVSALTTATIYPAGTAGAITNNLAESSTALLYNAGPRYYFVDSNTMFPFFDPDMFFERGEVRNHFNDPDTFVQPVFIWGNMLCPRRSTHCLVRPGGASDLYTSLYT
jgi:hypothetical protein